LSAWNSVRNITNRKTSDESHKGMDRENQGCGRLGVGFTDVKTVPDHDRENGNNIAVEEVCYSSLVGAFNLREALCT
jgi:hypothetical protein